MNASFLAILQNGEHVSWTQTNAPTKEKGSEWLHQAVVARLTGKVDRILHFVYALGTESQTFTKNEVREIYFS